MPNLTITPIVPLRQQSTIRRNKRLHKFCQYTGCDKAIKCASTPYAEFGSNDSLDSQLCECHKLKISKTISMFETVFSNSSSFKEVDHHIKNVVETEPRQDYYYCLNKEYFFHVTCETELVYQWFLLTWKPDCQSPETLRSRVKSCVYAGNLWQVPNCIFLDTIYVAVQHDLISALRCGKLHQVSFEEYEKAPRRIEMIKAVEEIRADNKKVVAIGISEPKILKYNDFVAVGFSSIEARMMEMMLKKIN